MLCNRYFALNLFIFSSLGCHASNNFDIEKCTKKDYSTAGMLNCSAKKYRIIDNQLNDIYKALYNLLSKEGKKELKTAERAWLQFRKTECIFVSRPDQGGTISPVLNSGCYNELTAVRLKKLKSYLKYYKTDPDLPIK